MRKGKKCVPTACFQPCYERWDNNKVHTAIYFLKFIYIINSDTF